MKQSRRKMSRARRGTRKQNKKSMKKQGKKKWVTAIDAAQNELSRSGSLDKARTALRLQAYQNARKLFGSLSEKL